MKQKLTLVISCDHSLTRATELALEIQRFFQRAHNRDIGEVPGLTVAIRTSEAEVESFVVKPEGK